MKTIDPPGCAIETGMVLQAPCPTCGHAVYHHLYPSAVCTMCWEQDKYDALEKRITELEKDLEKVIG